MFTRPVIETMTITIRPEDIYRQYQTDAKDPSELFGKAVEWINTIQQTSHTNENTVSKEIEDALVRAIYGSNMIERAGLGPEVTDFLCRKTFAGGNVEGIDPLMELLYDLQPDLKNRPVHHVLRGKYEIIQHIKAYQHLLHAFVTEKHDMTEDLIKETHRILTENVPIIQEGFPDIQPQSYGGIYRSVVVGAGTTNFSVPKYVPLHMATMCNDLKEDLATAETKQKIDPFSLAAKYSLQFVMIHPFQDGNGRMCRMILNAILFRFAGIVIPIGEQEDEREEYMGIKKRASRDMEGHGEYATFVLRKSVTRLRGLKKKLAGRRG